MGFFWRRDWFSEIGRPLLQKVLRPVERKGGEITEGACAGKVAKNVPAGRVTAKGWGTGVEA